MSTIPPEQLQIYQASARKRAAIAHQTLLQRQHQGNQIAHQAAALLKSEFGAQKVVLFGSLLDIHRMHPRSDIDLAVWGLDPKVYLQTVAALLDLSDFSIDLIEAESAPAKILAAIQATGIEL